MDSRNQLKVLSDFPIELDGIKIYAPRLSIINQITFERYMRLINLLTMSFLDLELFFDSQKIEGEVPEPFDYLYTSALKEPLFFLELQIAFHTFLRTEVTLQDDEFIIKAEEEKNVVKINKDNFTMFQKLIKEINFLEPTPEADFNARPEDEHFVKIFQEARRKLRLAKERERRRKNNNKDSNTTFADLVSSLCSYGVGYTVFNVWDLNIYQFYDQLYRNRAKESYGINIDLLMAGADKNKIDTEHWMKSIII